MVKATFCMLLLPKRLTMQLLNMGLNAKRTYDDHKSLSHHDFINSWRPSGCNFGLVLAAGTKRPPYRIYTGLKQGPPLTRPSSLHFELLESFNDQAHNVTLPVDLVVRKTKKPRISDGRTEWHKVQAVHDADLIAWVPGPVLSLVLEDSPGPAFGSWQPSSPGPPTGTHHGQGSAM